MKNFIQKNIFLLLAAAWLVTLAIIIDKYWSANASVKSVQASLTGLVQGREYDFRAEFDSTLARTKRNLEEGFPAFHDSRWMRKDYIVFIYESDSLGNYQLRFWNSALADPREDLLNSSGNSGFVQLSNGYFVWNRIEQAGVRALALIPVKWNFLISDRELKNRFADKTISEGYVISTEPGTSGGVVSIYGNELFDIVPSSEFPVSKNNPVSAWLLIAAAFVLLLIIHLAASEVARQKGRFPGMLFLVLFVIGLRTLSYFFPVPLDFRQYELFDPSIYGSNIFLGSLGDLLINSLLFIWIVFFIRSRIEDREVTQFSGSGKKRWVLLPFAGSLIIFLTVGGSELIHSLVADSSLSFDVLNFFRLNIYSVVGFIILCCFTIGYFFSIQLVVNQLKPFFPGKVFPLLISVSIISLVILSIRIGMPDNSFHILLLLWLLFFLFLMHNPYLGLPPSKIISSRLVFWFFFFSVSIAFVIIRENGIKEKLKQKKDAEKQAAKLDPTNELLVNTVLTDLNPEFLSTQFGRFYDSVSGTRLKDSLMDQRINPLVSRFNTRIWVFSPDETPLFNDDSSAYTDLNAILLSQAKKTSRPGLYYFDESYDRYSYISRIDVSAPDSSKLGYIFLIASPQSLRSESLLPEIFARGRTSDVDPSYEMGIYRDWQLVNRNSDYPFVSKLPLPENPPKEYEWKENGSYTELWHYAGAGRMVVIAKEKTFLLESITLFSYLFCTFLMIAGLLWLYNYVLRRLLRRGDADELFQLNIRNQIHGTVLLVSILSFSVIGLVTILFFNKRSESGNREMLNKTIRLMQGDINEFIIKKSPAAAVADMHSMSRHLLESELNRISDIYEADMSLFDLSGNLQASSHGYLYAKGILSRLMHPEAYYQLHYLDKNQFYQRERISDLSFSSIYIPLLNASGNKYAYLQLPYYTAPVYRNKETSSFLVAIINLNAFIFLLAGIVAFFITDRITKSFSMIAGKMKKVSVGGYNEVIEWRRNDEIGALVKEYNKMVHQLDESARSLARNEREGAWREMARQIAHEIKNPLTPMKLSLQYLQRALDNKEAGIERKTAEVSKTLIEQIDHLNHIANEFSQFSNIENARRESFDINLVLKNVLDLFRSVANLRLKEKPAGMPCFVLADRTHMNRVFTNIIQNALQSVPQGDPVTVSVEEEIRDGQLLIRISDNGAGIPEDLRPFIFTPNFTTKNSGTGLGLAMCKRMVEQAGGSIHFETESGKGTTFEITLPLEN